MSLHFYREIRDSLMRLEQKACQKESTTGKGIPDVGKSGREPCRARERYQPAGSPIEYRENAGSRRVPEGENGPRSTMTIRVEKLW